ncbi:MAG: SoxR reducing system RseC family protein [Prevotella sp.]|nr:SoxR reducing system RseC family protein [Prevotella sp.]
MNKISHQGIVEKLEGNSAVVRIVQTSACAACKAASHCSAAESKEKLVTAKIQGNEMPQVGDTVVVSMPGVNGRDAVVFAFVLPFIIMVVVLYSCLRLTADEVLAALVGIGSLVPYYLLLYLFRGRLKDRFSFVLENKSK